MPRPSESDPREPSGGDLDTLRRRQRRFLEREHRRRAVRQRIVGGLLGCVVIGGAGFGVYAWVSAGGQAPAPASSEESSSAPVRVDVGPPPVDPRSSAGGSDARGRPSGIQDGAGQRASGSGKAARGAAGAAGATAADQASAARSGRPIVWVQAGHADPREPGYRDQTGAGSGPFGSEIGFTTNLAPKVVGRLQRAGVDARMTAGLVTPLGAPGAAFVSLHHDTPEGAAAFGHAITGAGENWYHGEGTGTASPTPYPDSAPHRAPTTVSAAVERRSRDLANRIASRFRTVYTAANGARGRYTGVQPREGNPRMMRYYGFYRTRAEARVIVEAGAGSTDDAFLVRTDLIAMAISRGILEHLGSRGLAVGGTRSRPSE